MVGVSERKKLRILNEVLGDYYLSNEEYLFLCPKCVHHKKKLSVNISKDVFKCWVCDYSGRALRRLVRRYGSFHNRQAWDEFEERVDISSFGVDLFEEDSVNFREPILDLPEDYISLANKKLPRTASPALRYLYDRGVTKRDIIRWKIGYCSSGEFGARVIIPSFGMTGKCNYFIARTYMNDWKKYKNPSASKDIIFNHLYLDFDEDMVLVEGAFDAIVAGPNSVPLLGSTLREESRLFQELVKNDTSVYIALDSDAKKKENRIIKLLLKYGIEVYKIDTTGFDDVGTMSKESFIDRKNSSSLIEDTFYSIFENSMRF
jgi:DNA primase